METPGAKGILGGNGERLTRQLLESGVPRESGGTGVGAISVLASALEAFRPDLVMISAGLDGRKGHPCGLGDLVAKDYEWITSEASASVILFLLSFYFEVIFLRFFHASFSFTGRLLICLWHSSSGPKPHIFGQMCCPSRGYCLPLLSRAGSVVRGFPLKIF